MKRKIILICLLLTAILKYSVGQTSVKLMIPPGLQLAQGQENQLIIDVAGINGSSQSISEHITDISTVPGVLYFSIVIQPEQTAGYCDLRFNVVSKQDLEIMLKAIFCKLNAQSIQINDVFFTDCQKIIIP